MRRFFLASILLLIAGTANAAGPAPAATQPQPTEHSPAPAQAGEATRIEIDQKTGVIRFIVNGKEQARFDKDGLKMESSLLPQPVAEGASLSK